VSWWYNSPVIAQILQSSQPLTPVIVKVIPAPAKEIQVIDILLGSFGVVGLMLFGSALLGLVLGGLFVWYRDGPPVNPYQLNLSSGGHDHQ